MDENERSVVSADGSVDTPPRVVRSARFPPETVRESHHVVCVNHDGVGRMNGSGDNKIGFTFHVSSILMSGRS